MAHEHLVYDSDPHFSVDVDTRVISYQSPSKLVLVKDDHNSEIFTFDMPKEVDGHDVTLCDIKRIHYINLGSGKEESKDIYEIKDLQVSEEDENKVVFSWLVSSNATKYAGTLSFAIQFACLNDDNILSYNWRTLPYSSVPVSDSIYNEEAAIEESTDILSQWYNDIIGAGDSAVGKITEAKYKAIGEIDTFADESIDSIGSTARDAVNEIVETANNVGGVFVSTEEPTDPKPAAWLNPETGILRVLENGEYKALESIKGEPGGLDNVTQETGNSEELVMSQKAVSDELTDIQENLDTLNGDVSGINSQLNDIGPFIHTLPDTFNNHWDQIMQHDSSISALQTKDAEQDVAINNLQGKDRIHDDSITEIRNIIIGMSSEDVNIYKTLNDINTDIERHETWLSSIQNDDLSELKLDRDALQAKDAEHDEAIEALQTEVAEHDSKMVVMKTGSYVGEYSGSATPKPVRITLPMNVEYFVLRDMSFNEDSKNDLVLIKNARASFANKPSGSNVSDWESPYYHTVYTNKKTGIPVYTDEGDSRYAGVIAYNWTNPTPTTTEITICGAAAMNVSDGSGDASMFVGDRHTFNRQGVTYQWIAFGTKSQS